MKTTVIVPASDNNGLNARIENISEERPSMLLCLWTRMEKVENIETLEKR
jgi:hypothetical protein